MKFLKTQKNSLLPAFTFPNRIEIGLPHIFLRMLSSSKDDFWKTLPPTL